MINPAQFRDSVVIPACEKLGWLSDDAVNLLMGTAYQESRLKALRQYGGGPALSVFQIEPATYCDIWDNWLKYNNGPRMTISNWLGPRQGLEALETDLIYAAMMARVHYRRVRESLPNCAEGYARYWKKYYNTIHGAGTVNEFCENYATLQRRLGSN